MVLMRRVWCLLAAAMWMALTASAQSTTGTIRGVLTDDSGAVIPGANVSVAGNGIERAAGTQVDGSFAVSGLAPGPYSVHVVFPGFTPFNANVNVNAGTAIQVPIRLALIAERQQVTVQGDPGPSVSVEADNNATALVLRGQDLEALPDNPDDLQDALQALAGPAAGPNGSQVFVDGFSGGAIPPKEAIREIRINQNPFSAEYDKIGMGRIEILTKPGTDKYHATAFMNYGNGIFNARNPFSSNKPDFSNKMFGGNLSGPFTKHGSFFLTADERYIDNNAVIHATTIDEATLHAVAFNRSVLAPFRNTYVNPRVDYQLSPNHTLVARYQFVTWAQDAAGIGQFSLPSRAYASDLTEHSAQFTETAILGAKAVNETRFEFTRTQTSQNGDNSIPTVVVSAAFIGGGAQIGHSDNDLRHLELQNYTTVTHNTHTIRFGARLRRDTLENRSPQNFGGTFTFFGVAVAPLLDSQDHLIFTAPEQPALGPINSLEQYRRTLVGQSLGYSPALIRALGGGASQFSISTGNPLTSVKQFDAGVFAQDDWRMRPNLTLSLGLRFEGQTNIHDWTDFAPRIGIAWAPGSARNGRQKTVIRAGAGIFYDRVAEAVILQSHRFNGTNQQQYVVQNPDFFPNIPSTDSLTAQNAVATSYGLDHNLRSLYLLQSAIGVERQLPLNTTVAITFTNTRGSHLLQTVDINTPVPGLGVRPYTGLGNLFLYESGGILRQNMMVINFSSRLKRGFALFGNYSLSSINSDVDNGGAPSNPYDFKQDYGRSSLERRHRVQLVGSFGTPLRFRISPFIILQSGTPYNLIVGQDLNGDTLPLDRPAFASDLSRKTVRVTSLGAFDASPVAGEVIVPRNYLTGAGLISLNVRVARTFAFGNRNTVASAGSGALASMRFGQGGAAAAGGGRLGDGSLAANLLDGASEKRFTLTFSVIVANIINHVNPGGYVGALLSPLFSEATMLNGGFAGGIGGGAFGSPANNRRLEFQTRFAF
ncbi:MAG: TonB-dependent receptor [Terriglobia bacterium]|nr:MAG: TonB-dependent receptor [Terriglobia bacterium]